MTAGEETGLAPEGLRVHPAREPMDWERALPPSSVNSMGYGICPPWGKKGMQPASGGLEFFLKCKSRKSKLEISHAEYRRAKAGARTVGRGLFRISSKIVLEHTGPYIVCG